MIKYLPIALLAISFVFAIGIARSELSILQEENEDRKTEIMEIRENKTELAVIKERLKAMEKRQDKEFIRQERLLGDILHEVRK